MKLYYQDSRAIVRQNFFSVRVVQLFIYLFIIKSYTTDRHTVRTMEAVKAALNTNTRQNTVYKITRKPCTQ